jgi:drug/metabolite transporter (DMT)-like permease
MLICFGLFEIISTLFFFTAIQKVENPAMVSFVGNVGPVLITLGGVFFLRERFSRIEVIGIIIAIAGAFLVTSGGNPAALLTFDGIEYLAGSVIANSLSILLAKAYIKSLSPAILAFIRSFFLWIACLVLLLINHESPSYTNSLFLIIAVGAVLGPFLGSFAAYSALRFIGAGRSVIIQTCKSILILILAWPLLGLWPHGMQLAGGLMTVTGVILMIVLRERVR